MNKAAFQSVYCQKRANVSYMSEFCELYPDLLDRECLTPEFVLNNPSVTQSAKSGEKSDNVSSISSTVSFCAHFSRVPVDRVLYGEVLRKRVQHPVFLELEKPEDREERPWLFIDERTRRIVGPLSSAEMNSQFTLNAFSDTTQIKRRYEEEFYPLSVLIKRYLKNVLNERLDIHKTPAPLSIKVTRFRKGEAMAGRLKEKEVYEPRHREKMCGTEFARQLPINLKTMLRGDFDKTDLEDARTRANTAISVNQRPCFA